MIGLERTSPPLILSGPRAQRALEEAREFFETDTRGARQRQYDFEQHGILFDPEVEGTLEALTHGRCAFCGMGGTNEDAVIAPHRLRPPQDAVASDGKTSRRHYWWLAFAWPNLYPACAACRKAQGAKFPTGRRRVRVGTVEELFAREEPLLLDPCIDDPEHFLVYLDSGEVVSRNPRGKATIETFDLNRPELIDERGALIEVVQMRVREIAQILEAARFAEFADSLSSLYSRRAPFAAVRRQFINQWVQFRWRKIGAALTYATGEGKALQSLVGSLRRVTNRVKEEVAVDFFGIVIEEAIRPLVTTSTRISEARRPERIADSSEEELLPYLNAAEIRRVEIRNFRVIESLDLEVTPGPSEGSWMMLLGENGAGKTSVLQAIALTLCDPATLKRLDVNVSRLLRQGAGEGLVRVMLTGSRRGRELRFGKKAGGLVASGTPREGTLIAGYGSTRLLRDSGSRGSVATVENLFDPLARRTSPKAWLPKLSSSEFDAVARALRMLLQLDEKEEIVRGKGSGLEIVRGKRRLELRDLSDGYRAMAALALDMMRLFLRRWGSVEAAEGIVLIDELGAHLHPRWQMRVTDSLRTTFPRVQFITTTHDPLCLRGLHDGEVVVLRRRDEHIYAVHDQLPPVEGLTVDQLLTSEHFGLSSSLDPAIEELFARYYDLLAQRKHSAKERRELAGLSNRLDELRLLGTTRRERLALEAVDESLASERRAISAADLSRLDEDTKRQVREVWGDVTAR
ncbi:MAG TPA: AAA family ATPase [Solirubrobacterales bacterium]|nr:AAA family ATPase [Solirubrobacterales bacterium]